MQTKGLNKQYEELCEPISRFSENKNQGQHKLVLAAKTTGAIRHSLGAGESLLATQYTFTYLTVAGPFHGLACFAMLPVLL